MQGDLFEKDEEVSSASMPLAARMRPSRLEDVKGQDHLTGEGKPLKMLSDSGSLSSLILFGPPGTGKTTIARILAQQSGYRFVALNAVESNVPELRKQLEQARVWFKKLHNRSLLFIDEIHRFNKAQQDVLLPDVEQGTIALIGATTHNPSFYVIPPLLSRSHVFELKALREDDLVLMLEEAWELCLQNEESVPLEIDDDAKAYLIQYANGDARRLLNAVELLFVLGASSESKLVDLNMIQNALQTKAPLYDRNEDEHYDTISAFIKSIRGSDPDAAIYWLAKMLVAGEDPRFIARRLIVHSAEDIGLADPRALSVATAAMQAVEFIGMPEARIVLSEATLYLATAPKSNSSIMAIDQAMSDIKSKPVKPVPDYLKDSHYAGAKKLGRGEGYLYSHDYPAAIAPQSYGVEKGSYYEPSERGYEKTVRERIKFWDECRGK